MQNISKSVPDMKVTGWWLIIVLFDIDELYLRENCALLSPRAVHSSYNVSEKAIIRNRKRTDAMFLPCLTPTLKYMAVSILPIMSWTTML